MMVLSISVVCTQFSGPSHSGPSQNCFLKVQKIMIDKKVYQHPIESIGSSRSPKSDPSKEGPDSLPQKNRWVLTTFMCATCKARASGMASSNFPTTITYH